MSVEKDFNNEVKKVFHQLALLFSLMMIVCCSLIYYLIDPNLTAFNSEESSYETLTEIDDDRIEDGIHVRTGLKEGEGLMTVVNNCTNCHSSKLVTQNRMSRERWNATIRWMQETQNLWDLGENQKVIVDYLVTNYPVQEVGRRANLTEIDWYELEN